MPEERPTTCACQARPAWAEISDDSVLTWPVVETGEWEELRRCPSCGTLWYQFWPEEMEGSAILSRPRPPSATRLRDMDRAEAARGYCLMRLEQHLGDLKEEKTKCIKSGCGRRRVRGTEMCVEHHIAQRFGRNLSRLDRDAGGDL